MTSLFGQLCLAIPVLLGALGSAMGVGTAGRAAAGAWAKDARAGKPFNFAYLICTGAPLSQTVYGFILMLVGLKSLVYDPVKLGQNAWAIMSLALAGGAAEWISAWMQGTIGAAGCRCLSESEGKGFAFILIALGMAETVGLFGFIFPLLALP